MLEDMLHSFALFTSTMYILSSGPLLVFMLDGLFEAR